MKFEFNTHIDKNHQFFQTESLKESYDYFVKTINNPANGFFHFTDDLSVIDSVYKLHDKISHKKNFVQIGIGGSALGPQMLISALKKKTDKTFSLLDNTDADYIYDQLNSIEIKDTIFYVVSKSGGTAETIACYSIVRNILKQKGISADQFKDYFIFCTDKENGQLREHVNKNQYDSLVVPANVGGRYSVLTSVGLLPALFMGIDIKELLSGANKIKPVILNESFQENEFLYLAATIQYLFNNAKPSVNQTVLMPYSSKLKDFSFWFVQLWAESLGKIQINTKQSIGLTPIPAYGATDQHSQVQLFMEGPNDKFLMLVHIENKEHNFELASDLEFESAKKLQNFTMNELLEAEFIGTLKALEEQKRNFLSLKIAQLDESNLGQLILFFESLTAIMGHYLKVDPFDQPGVEKGKKYAFEYLNSLRK